MTVTLLSSLQNYNFPYKEFFEILKNQPTSTTFTVLDFLFQADQTYLLFVWLSFVFAKLWIITASYLEGIFLVDDIAGSACF